MSELQEVKKPLSVIDPHELDSRIPKGLMMIYSGKPYVLKSGLEWKATQLFGVGRWSLETEIVKYEPKERYALIKARVKVNGAVYEDFGEASPENVPNRMMHKYILLLAVTRAGNRALRRATACGYCSLEELDTEEAVKAIDNDPQWIKDTDNGKCKTCGATGKYHAKDCPNFKKVEK